MGYYTEYALSANNAEGLEDKITKDLEEISGYSIRFGYSDSCKWYNHQDDMLTLSKIYPNVVFVLEGEGEESEDLWIKYFKNGKMQVCKAEITFEKFDENKLK